MTLTKIAAAILLTYSALCVCAPVFGQSVRLPVATDPRPHGVTEEQLDSLSEIMRQAVHEKQISGCSFLVAHKGKVVFRKAFGYADLESKRPFTTDELVPIASVSKPFLASVIMALVEQGKLKLDDPVTQYLPEFKGMKVAGSKAPARPMTIRHLLSHTAGFWGNKGITPEKLDLIRNFERPLSEAVASMSDYDLLYEPGTKFLYSGSGYCVAGRVAEVALGKSLEEIAQDALFRPMGLDRTTFLPSKEIRAKVPSAYRRQGGKLLRQPTLSDIDELRFILPGGSLFTTLDDLAVFGQMHLDDGVSNGKRVLSEASVTEMRRLQSLKEGLKSYGLGWFRGDVSEAGLADLLFHNGALGAHLRVDRRREVVTVFLVHQTAGPFLDLKNRRYQQVNEMFTPHTRDAAKPIFESKLFKKGALIYSDDFDGTLDEERWERRTKSWEVKDGVLVGKPDFASAEEAMKALKRDHHLGLSPVIRLNHLPEKFVLHLRVKFEGTEFSPGRPKFDIGHHINTVSFTETGYALKLHGGQRFSGEAPGIQLNEWIDVVLEFEEGKMWLDVNGEGQAIEHGQVSLQGRSELTFKTFAEAPNRIMIDRVRVWRAE